jgi:hypothetical protein
MYRGYTTCVLFQGSDFGLEAARRVLAGRGLKASRNG